MTAVEISPNLPLVVNRLHDQDADVGSSQAEANV